MKVERRIKTKSRIGAIITKNMEKPIEANESSNEPLEPIVRKAGSDSAFCSAMMKI